MDMEGVWNTLLKLWLESHAQRSWGGARIVV